MKIAGRSATANGAVVQVEDPAWDLAVDLAYRDGRPVLTRLEVRARIDSPSADVTAERLRQLPVREVLGMAASVMQLDLDEDAARLLVQPKPAGQRSWGPDHYDRVLAVYDWARAAGRRGGGRGAVAEFWDVKMPTVEAWLRIAREQREAAQTKPATKTARKPAPRKAATASTIKTPRAGRRG